MNKVPNDGLGREVIKVPRPLDATEVGTLESNAVKLDMQIEALLAEKKSVMADYNAQVKKARADKKFLHVQIQTAVVEDEVECFLIPDYKAGTMQYVDIATSNIVKVRPLTMAERQLDLANEASKLGGTSVTDRTGTHN